LYKLWKLIILPKLKAGIWHLSTLMYISTTASCQKIHLYRVTAATVPIEILYGGTFVGIDHAASALSSLTSSCPPHFAGDDENPGEYVNLSKMKP
jgi:hypothetical protein